MRGGGVVGAVVGETRAGRSVGGIVGVLGRAEPNWGGVWSAAVSPRTLRAQRVPRLIPPIQPPPNTLPPSLPSTHPPQDEASLTEKYRRRNPSVSDSTIAAAVGRSCRRARELLEAQAGRNQELAEYIASLVRTIERRAEV